MSRSSVKLLIASAVLFGGVAAAILIPEPEPTFVTSAGMWDDWVLLDQPESQPLVGQGWALTGSPETTCYSVNLDMPEAQSVDQFQVSWNKEASIDAVMKIAEVVGAQLAVAHTNQGRISFDSVVIRRARDVRPLFGSCQDAHTDMLPRLPVVTAMIGASGFELEVGDSLQGRAAIEALRSGAITADATFEMVNANRIHVSFGSLRWIGAHLSGYTSAKVDTAYSEVALLDAVSASDLWNFVAHGDESDRYSVEVRPKYPPLDRRQEHSDLLDGDVFPVSLQGSSLSSGTHVLGRLELTPGLSAYRIVLFRRKYEARVWERNSDRPLLEDWLVNHGVAGP